MRLLTSALFVGLTATGLVGPPILAQSKIVFSPRERQDYLGVHICPDGKQVNGIHVANNVYRCTGTVGLTQGALIIDGDNEPPTACEVSDGSGNKLAMHCCPSGTAIVGVHIGNNWLVCGALDQQAIATYAGKLGVTQRVDPPPTGHYLHECPKNMPMLGFHEGRNLLLCLAVGPE